MSDETLFNEEEEGQAVGLPVAHEGATLIERLATDPNVDVDKLERLIAMQERASMAQAQQAYTAAFVSMQPELPNILKRGKSHQSSYAKMEDIQRALGPVLKNHGFVLNFYTDTEGGNIKVTARLSHAAGHYEETSFTTQPDLSGKKNDIQAQGSAQTYAMRYATVALLNLTTTDMDDDGVGSEAPEAPEGYEDWLMDMEAVAEEGTARLQEVWKASNKEHKAYLTKHSRQTWDAIKERARKA